MIWGLRNLGKGHRKCKGPEVGTRGVGSGNGEAIVAEVRRLPRDAVWGLGDGDHTWRSF